MLLNKSLCFPSQWCSNMLQLESMDLFLFVPNNLVENHFRLIENNSVRFLDDEFVLEVHCGAIVIGNVCFVQSDFQHDWDHTCVFLEFWHLVIQTTRQHTAELNLSFLVIHGRRNAVLEVGEMSLCKVMEFVSPSDIGVIEAFIHLIVFNSPLVTVFSLIFFFRFTFNSNSNHTHNDTQNDT